MILAPLQIVAQEQIEDLRFETDSIANGYATKLSVGYLNRYEGWEVQAAVAAFTARHPRIEISASGGNHDELYRMLKGNEADLLFSDKRRAFDDAYVNKRLATCFEYVEVSESSPYAEAEVLRVSDLTQGACILISGPELEGVESSYYRDVLNFKCELRFVRSREEGRMMVAGNRGFMPIELREKTDAQGSIVRRIPLVDAHGTHIAHEYYAFWAKSRTNDLIEEFARILEELFESSAVTGKPGDRS